MNRLASAIWYAAYRIQSGSLAPDDFMSFSVALLMLYPPIKALNGVNMNIQQGLAAAARVFELLDVPQETKDKESAKSIDNIHQEIEFKDVSFRYGDKHVPAGSKQGWVLKDINLKVKKGEVIAIVGTSGVGKTTFVNLIPRFYDVSGGTILIDGLDIRDMSRDSLRAQIAIVSQQVILFNDTVKRNIAYGDLEKGDEGIINAAKDA